MTDSVNRLERGDGADGLGSFNEGPDIGRCCCGSRQGVSNWPL